MASRGVSNKATVKRGDIKVSLIEYENDEWHKCEDMMFAIMDALLGFGYGPGTIKEAFDQVVWEYGWRDEPVENLEITQAVRDRIRRRMQEEINDAY